LEDLGANLQCTKDGLIVSKPVIRLQAILVRITFNRKSYYKTFKSVRSMQCATPDKSLNLNKTDKEVHQLSNNMFSKLNNGRHCKIREAVFLPLVYIAKSKECKVK
jgi:hypothetical protein